MPVKPEPYDIGDPVDIEVRFLNATDQLIDPAGATTRISCPDGAVITRSLAQHTRLSTGVYELAYTVANGPGRYRITTDPDGDLPAGRQSFQVRDPD